MSDSAPKNKTSTARYLILTTIWAALLPGLVVSTPFVLLACLMIVGVASARL